MRKDTFQKKTKIEIDFNVKNSFNVEEISLRRIFAKLC